MGPAVVFVALVVLSLVVLAATMRAGPRGDRSREPSFRKAAPLILVGVLVAAGVLVVIVHAPWIVVAGLSVYIAFAIATMWRMVRLDNTSRWMTPDERRLRLSVSVIGLTWLGIVLGLLLRIAAVIATGPY